VRPYDGQGDVLDSIEHRLSHPSLTAEELGRIALMLDRFVKSGLISREEAEQVLVPRMVGMTS
jgi:hypothetical protein